MSGSPYWRMSTSFGVRQAGLPAAVLSELRFTSTIVHIERMLTCRDRLAADGAALADALHPVIGATGDGTLRGRLIGLRRAVFGARRPQRSEYSAGVVAALPDELVRRLDHWLAMMDGYGEMVAALPAVFAAEQADRLVALRKCADDPLFRRALSQAGPALFGELDKWLGDEHRRPGRRTVLGLINFVSRAAAKTSPYSTFTCSGRGEWAAGDAPVLPGTPGRPVGVLELHGMIEQGIVLELAARPAIADRMRVRVNPSLTRAGDRLTFLGRAAQEPIVGLPATAAVEACLRYAAATPTLAELRCSLGADRPSAAARLLDKLLSVGLLELQTPVCDQSGDPLGELADWLGDAPLTDQLRTLRGTVRRHVDVDDVAGHLDRQRELHAAVDAVSDALAIDTDADGPRKAAFHENAVHPGVVLRCGAAAFHPALSDLDAFRLWLAAMDPTLPLRLALGALIRERYDPGAALSFIDFYRLVHETLQSTGDGLAAEVRDYFDITTPSRLTDSTLPRIRQLHTFREQARAVLRAAPDADGVVRVPADRLRELAAGWPAWIAAPHSLACYLQLLPGDPPGLVVNLATPGYGRGRSRLFRLIEQAGGDASLDSWPPREPVLAEIGGVFTSAVNRRLATAPYEIDYPGTVSARPAEQRIPLSDLMVRCDPVSGEASLHSIRLDARIRPAHLGMMAEFLLPPAARTLTLVFGDTFLVHPSLPLVDTVADAVRVTETVRHQPRVAVGHVVVRRARWTAAVATIPRAQRAEDWPELLDWLRRNSIPRRCFVRVWGGGPTDDARVQRWVLGKSRKPLYVDFDSWFAVRMFTHHLAAGGEVVIFEEALPDPADTAPGERVTEFLMEISGTGGGS
jgi:hypothetical protein